MNDLLIFIALFMLYLGPIQVLWALIWIITTKYDRVRYHLGKYLMWVLIYFAAFLLAIPFEKFEVTIIIVKVHFFGSAFALFAYHLWIVDLGEEIKQARKIAQQNADSERLTAQS